MCGDLCVPFPFRLPLFYNITTIFGTDEISPFILYRIYRHGLHFVILINLF